MFRDAVVIFLVLMGAGACASNPAQSSAAVPLDTPEPPPRVAMSPVAAPEPPPPDRQAPPPVRATAPASSPTPAPAPASRAAAPPPATTPEPAPPAPSPELRPAASAGQSPTAAQVTESFNRAKQKLDAINPTRLNAGKRADYDSARRFLAQAEAAVKENNLMLAQSSAAKAETLADGLR